MPTLYQQCECSKAISPSRWRAGKRNCPECALAKMLIHNHQMSLKKGPEYDTWVESMRASLPLPEESDKGDKNGSQGKRAADH